MRRAFTLTEAVIVIGVVSFVAWIILPPSIWHGGSRHNAYRAMCQTNLKRIGLAMQQYASDYNDRLPLRTWAAPLAVYAKTDAIFQCAETNATSGTTDYFFNARFSNKRLGSVKLPSTLILFGDGQDDAPLDATLTQLPVSWRTDEKSPSFRHLGLGNYLFADGHVKWSKPNSISRDFRMVTR